MGRGAQVKRFKQEAKLLLGLFKGQADCLQHLTLQG